MRISTRLMLIAAVPAVMALAIGLGLFSSYRMAQSAELEDRVVQRVMYGSSKLNSMVYVYMFYDETRPVDQFLWEHDELVRVIANHRFGDGEQQRIADHIGANLDSIRQVFVKLASADERPEAVQDPGLLSAAQERLAGQLLVLTDDVVTDTARLERLVDAEIVASQGRISLLVSSLVVIGAGAMTLLALQMTRGMRRSLLTLRRGTEMISAGDLGHRLRIKTGDELGDLGRSFDYMAERLQAVTVSRDALQQEVAQRLRAEESLARSEERFRSLAENSPDIIVRLGPQLRLVYLNPAAERTLGLAEASLLGQTVAQLFPDQELAAQWAEKAGKALNTGEPSAMEFRFSGPNGPRYYQALIAPELGEDGSVRSLITITRDLTARKQLEDAKDEFIGFVSHELRTPLTVIMAALGTSMTPGVTPEEARDLLCAAMSGAETLANIVDNLVELSRHQTGRLELGRGRMDLACAVQRTVAEEGSSHGRPYILDIAEGLPAVPADEARIELVLRNLLHNAAQYSAEGTGITVRVVREDNSVVVSVTDRGIGIPEDQQGQLFQPFERLDKSGRTAKGLGLGLVVCRRLVEAHGGRIWFQSKAGCGSTFYFSLPLEGAAAPRPVSVR